MRSVKWDTKSGCGMMGGVIKHQLSMDRRQVKPTGNVRSLTCVGLLAMYLCPLLCLQEETSFPRTIRVLKWLM